MIQVQAIACFAGAATIAAFFFARSAKAQLLEFSSLKETGVATRGIVTNADKGPPLRLIYEFAPAGGEARKYPYSSKTKGLKPYSAGDEVEILYAADEPRINTIKELFDDKLAALQSQADRMTSLPWQTAIVFALTLWWVWIAHSSS